MALQDASSDSAATSRARYVNLSEAVKEILYLRQVQDFKKSWKRILNTSHWTKHIDVKHHLVRDMYDTGKVRVVCDRTGYQHADAFTKPLDVQQFHKYAKVVFNVV